MTKSLLAARKHWFKRTWFDSQKAPLFQQGHCLMCFISSSSSQCKRECFTNFNIKKKKENEQSCCLSEKLYCVRADKKRIIHWWWWWGLHAEALEQMSGRRAPVTLLIAICGRKVEFKWVMKQSYGISGVCEVFLQAESLKNSIILFFVAKEEQHLILWVSPERLN